MHSQVIGSHLKGAAGTGRGFFKNQGHIFPLAELVGDALFLLLLQIRCQVKQEFDLRRGEVQQLQKAPVGQIFHVVPPEHYLELILAAMRFSKRHRSCVMLVTRIK